MRSGVTGYFLTAGLAVLFAVIAKDLLVPLAVVAMMGLFDRLIGDPAFRQNNKAGARRAFGDAR